MTTALDHKDTIKSLYASFASGDIPSVLSAMASDVTWTEPEGNPYPGTQVGHDAVVQNVFMKLGTEWDGFAVVPHDYVAEGNTVVTYGQMSATYKATGKSFKSPFVHIWKFGADRIQSFSGHMDTLIYQRAMQ